MRHRHDPIQGLYGLESPGREDWLGCRQLIDQGGDVFEDSAIHLSLGPLQVDSNGLHSRGR